MQINYRARIEIWLARAAGFLALEIACGAGAFHYVVKDLKTQGWMDAILFSVQTITTTGYGNFSELFNVRPNLRFLSVCLMLFGALTWAIFTGLAFLWLDKRGIDHR